MVVMSSATKIVVFKPSYNRTLPSENLRDKMSVPRQFIQPMFISYNGLDNAAKISNFVVDAPVYYNIVKYRTSENSLRYHDVYHSRR